MNTLQFYYTHTVLGVSSVLQPKGIRDSYRLHPSCARKAGFLFFCDQIQGKEGKQLIQKIAGAMGLSEYLILEIINPQNPHTPFILNNFLSRFRPKGFVVFGLELARRLMQNPLPAEEDSSLLKWQVSQKGQTFFTVPACLLDTLSAFIGPDSPHLRKKKESAWNRLKKYKDFAS